jgi:hypothetical protein
MMEDALTPLLQPDVLLPTQYWETVTRRHRLEPEQRLMLAVLEDAVWTYRKYLFTQKVVFTEVEEWFFEEDSDWLFSFGNICDVLGFSAERIRQGLLRCQPEKSVDDRVVLKTNYRQRLRVVNPNIWTERTNQRPRAAL